MNPEAGARRLRADLPFRRIALVLSGGGALGAYEVGVLKVLERLGVAPSLVAGVSIGAVNAVVWLAHGRDTAALERAWSNLRGSQLGLQWMTLVLRACGALAATLGLLEIVLTITGSRELSGSFWLWKKSSARIDLVSTQMDITSWLVIITLGLFVVFFARRIEGWLAHGAHAADPAAGRRLLGRITLGYAAVHALVWVMGWPWPHRFSASLVLVLALAWLGSGQSTAGQWFRRIVFSLMPETGGRGLWGGIARRKVIRSLVEEGDPGRIVGEGAHLVVSALAVDSGRVTHFVSWPHPDAEFVHRVEEDLGEVVPMRTPAEMIDAVVASSAIPGVFEPEKIDGRDFVDAGGFSNQPLHLAIAHDADAVISVLLTPSHSPTSSPSPPDLFALGGRLLELANWRDMQAELRQLPPGWSRTGRPAQVCVIEPQRSLPSSVLAFEPAQAQALIALGEQDAWRALEIAGWLEPVPATEHAGL